MAVTSDPPETTVPGPWVAGLSERPRSDPYLALPATAQVAAPGWVAVEAFPALSFDDPVSMVQAPRTNHLFVAEREGRIYAFENHSDVQQKVLSLDLSRYTQGENDSGLLGMAFHPEFGEADSPNRAYVYLHYAHSRDPVTTPSLFTETVSRLARFSVDLETFTINPTSELVLIEQQDGSIWHQGGAMFFHPDDGFLYLAVGDEGAGNCDFENCQRIDKDLFSGVLRIDVDMRGGDVSHPIPKQPETGATANYFIPNDNPFVGEPGVLEEFYALGLRSPHKMTYDVQDGIVWIGEVGQSQREELNVLTRGANFQWNVLEGLVAGQAAMPEQVRGTWTPPILELDRSEAGSVIGGYVYRGSRVPYLYGKYIFADFVNGRLWALSYTHDGSRTNILGRELLFTTPFRDRTNGITSFGVDEDNELYILTLGDQAKIYTLDRTGGFSNAPGLLSETGAFTDVGKLQPATGLVPYTVQSPLWSDGARKTRWASVPSDAAVQFSSDGSWILPAGTVLVKHFELALDEANPADVRRLETRLLVAGPVGDYYGLTYKWNGEQTDASLLLESQTEEISVRRSTGELELIQYFYPGPGDCVVCHNAAAGGVLGLRTGQLNGNMHYEGTQRTANQLFTWSAIGLLDEALSQQAVAELPQLAPLSEEGASLEIRVRSYWATNCSMCHGTVDGLRASWDARFETPLEDQGVIWGLPIDGVGVGEQFLVVPGDPDRSVLYTRSASTIPGVRMPPLGRSSSDRAYEGVLRRWITSLGSE